MRKRSRGSLFVTSMLPSRNCVTKQTTQSTRLPQPTDGTSYLPTGNTRRDTPLPAFGRRSPRCCVSIFRTASGLGAGVLCAAFFVAARWGTAGAQTISATTYPFAASTGAALEDLSSGATQLIGSDQDDRASNVTAIGFDFWFVGTRHTQFSVNSNGLIHLGGSVISVNFVNGLGTTTDDPQIAPYWDDLRIGTNGQVRAKVIGSAPSRKLVIEWQNMQIPRLAGSGPGSATFQCWLEEGTGRISFVYGGGLTSNGTFGGYSVGIASSATLLASVSTGPSTAAYGTANDANTAVIASGTRYTFTPQAPAAPTNLVFSGV